MKILLLKKDIESDTVGDCLNEINDVITDTKNKLDKLVKDIGLSELLPADWKEKGCTVDQIGAENIRKIGQIVSGLASSAAAAFVGYYIFTGVTVAVELISVITSTAVGVLSRCGGALLGAVIGGAAFLITDMIASAITGAIERKELNEAIDSLQELKDQLGPRLREAAEKLGGVAQSIRDGLYRLDDRNILVKKPDGSYAIIALNAANSRSLSILPKEGIPFLSA